MPTERNNRQLSEISDSKCEEVAKKLLDWCAYDDHASLNELNIWDCRMLAEFILERERETRRETLMEAAKTCANLGDSSWAAKVLNNLADEVGSEKGVGSSPVVSRSEDGIVKFCKCGCHDRMQLSQCGPCCYSTISEAPPSTGPTYDPTQECCEFTKDASGVEQHKPECRNREAATSEGAMPRDEMIRRELAWVLDASGRKLDESPHVNTDGS